jgi:hypothetical protein
VRLNKVDGIEDKDIIMAKFTNSQWTEDFLNGNLYMNNFNHFIEQEKRTKEKGQGDSFEAALVTEIQNIKLHDGNNNVFATSKSGRVIERYSNVKHIPLFCMALFNSKDFEVLDVSDKSVKFMIDIAPEEKDAIRKAFKSDTVLFTFSPEVFVQRVIESLLPIDPNLLYGSVKYVDYSIMDAERRKNFDEMTPEFLFTKHLSLQYQREYRFVLPGIKSTGPYIQNIGDLRDLFSVVSTDDFLENSYIELTRRE